MNHELLTVLEYLEQERGLSRDVIIESIEKALLSAGRKSIHPANELTVKINPQTGDIRAWAALVVVESMPNVDQILIDRARERFPQAQVGDKIDWEVTPKDFGRIAASSARQAILQCLRQAEKNIVKDEYEDRIGQIVNGTIKRIDQGAYYVDLPKAEGILGAKDRVRTEQYRVGDRINALLVKVDATGSGPSLILSRSSTEFVKRLFEREVSELRDGTVEIRAISREPGLRTKMIVYSPDPNVDPVGTCVGMHGMRVKNVTAEFGGEGGERIDIMPWDDNICELAKAALKPGKASRAEMASDGESIDVYLSDDESRRAYGKRAINLKLAQRLLGRQINLVIENDAEKEESFEMKQAKAVNSLAEELGIDRDTAQKLVSAGFLGVDQLREADVHDIEAIETLSEAQIDAVFDALDDIDQLGEEDA